MAASLSSQDVARLLTEPSPDVRAELAEKSQVTCQATVFHRPR